MMLVMLDVRVGPRHGQPLAKPYSLPLNTLRLRFPLAVHQSAIQTLHSKSLLDMLQKKRWHTKCQPGEKGTVPPSLFGKQFIIVIGEEERNRRWIVNGGFFARKHKHLLSSAARRQR
mmetsp:Transcript_78313/g.153239  ORF Transcript_78313/g.153239 Transcript_78313/m.153239 type:complete len:117 (-) Transcript_78313:674-1024(-)